MRRKKDKVRKFGQRIGNPKDEVVLNGVFIPGDAALGLAPMYLYEPSKEERETVEAWLIKPTLNL